MLRIGFNGRSLQNHGGIGSYTRHLLRHLTAYTEDDHLLIFVPDLALLDFLPAGVHWQGIEVPGANRVYWEQVRLPGVIAEHALDLFHSPDFTLPGRLRVPGIVTIHDLSFVLHPKGVAPRTRWLYRTYVPSAVALAAQVLCDSHATRKDLEAQGWCDPAKLVVVPLGTSDEYFVELDEAVILDYTRRAGLPRDYLLYLGALDKRKNLTTLLKAYRLLSEELPEQVPTPALVLAGPDHGELASLMELAANLEIAESLHYLGYVPEADLHPLMQGARAFAYPSEFEGFGLPPLDAMACGTPVVCSNATSLPEVVGEAAILLDPHDVVAWATSLATLVSDADAWIHYHQAGLARARTMTWRQTARATLAAYERVAQGSVV